MSAFDLVGASARGPFSKWLPPVGGLVAAAMVASIVCRLPFSHSLALAELLALAVQNVLVIFLVTALTVWLLSAISLRPTGLDRRRLILRTSVDALWLAPLVLFIREDSPWEAAITAVLVGGIVKSMRLLQSHALIEHQDEPFLDRTNSSPRNSAFSLLESSSCFRRQLFAAGAALCAQTGAFAAFAGYPFKAALLVGVSSAVWTWSFTRYDSPKTPASSPVSLLVVFLAVVLTAGALIPYLRPMYGVRGFGLPNFARYAASQGDGRGPLRRTANASILPASEGDPGIVLLPYKQTHTKLVAPAPAIADALLTGRGAKPLEIPFEGVYWFFRAPDVHPPRASRQGHGSPEMLDIRSTDQRPLSMEARENLGSMINLDCCSRIQVAIRNADHYPATVSLELVLIDSSVPGKPFESLGRTPVRSKHPWKSHDQSPPANETLNFALPAKAALRRFDEVRIVFRIDAARADTGPRIAIDRLVLIPRGL